MKTIRFDPPPGCVPYRNERLMRVRQAQSGLPLIEFLREFHPPTPRAKWLEWIARGEITGARGEITGGDGAVSKDAPVSAGERYLHVMPDYVEPQVNATIGIIHEDESLLVVDKPAPLPVHPSGRFNRNTLSKLLEQVYPEESLRIAHRLDANTTGVVVFCRTAAAAAIVQPQFESRQVEKHYLARVQGHVPWHEYRCELEIGDAKCFGNTNTAGARLTHPSGQPAETLFRCLDRFDDGTTLLQVSPITGRTNQIRVHAAAIGFPIVGDPFYGSSHAEKSELHGRRTQTLGVDEPAMCLHAWRISLVHPGTSEQIGLESQTTGWKPMPHPNTGWKPMPRTFESTPPDWAKGNHAR